MQEMLLSLNFVVLTLYFATTYSNCVRPSFQVWQAKEAGAEQKPAGHAARGHPLPHRPGGTAPASALSVAAALGC